MRHNQVIRAGKRTAASVSRISSAFQHGAVFSVLMFAALVLSGCAGLVSGTTSNPPSPSPLVISNVQTTSTTSTSEIVWTTNVAADSVVNYGTTTSYGYSTPVDSAMVTNHQLTLSGLAAGTTYYYEVASADSKGNHGKSGGHSFKTLGFSISGAITPAAGGSGATLTLTGAANATTTADSLGNYTFVGLPNGTYAIAPSHAGFTFTPSSKSTTVNGTNVTGMNFTDTAASAAPTITTQPVNQAVTSGQTATFAVVATGTAPLSYQWSKNGAAISGATSSTFTTSDTTSSDNGAQFTVVVSNSAGSVTSATATLTVTAAPVAPTITTQPANQTVTAGQTATFTVVATGTAPLSYQWQKNGANIAGAISASYTTAATTTSDSGAKFDVVVSSSVATVTSATVTLTVSAAAVAPTITAQPASQSVTAGQTATFTVAATGTAPLSYQWQKNGTAISGATSSTYTTPAETTSDNGAQFSVLVSNAVGNAASKPAILTVTASNTAPSIATQPSNQTITAGQTATFSVTANGTPPLNYQWSKNGGAISGATSSTYTTPAETTSDNGAQFSVLVSNAVGNVTSKPATLTVNAATNLLTVSPASLSFGNVPVGASATQKATLQNSGNSNVTISNTSVSGPGFNASGVSAGTILNPSQTATLSVTFAPAASGNATGSVSVASDATNAPATITLSGSGQSTGPPGGTWISGYFASGNGTLPPSSIPWTKYTHIIHFAGAPGVDSSGNGNGTVELHWLSQADINAVVASKPAGKQVLVCIKDNDSHLGAFAQSTSPGVIATFVSNIASFANANQYDGVDIDWEQNINVTQYEDLLTRLRAALPGKTITMTAGNWGGLDSVAGTSYSQVDQINVMCYDMDIGTGFSWYNDPLTQAGNTNVSACDWRVHPFLVGGVPAGKIGIGVPFYGRRWAGVTQALVSGNFSTSTVKYRDLVTDMARWQSQYQSYDAKYESDYLSIPPLNEFDSFTGTQSINAAVSWERSQGFGGFMTFTLDYEFLSGQTGDARYPLSAALCQSVFGSCP